jgi:asparagine synthase (glutamine-hydrolysing)
MCGISGWLGGAVDETTVVRVRDALVHRGPDDAGAWTDSTHGLALLQRRLSIVDLSPAGHQPMLSADGRYVIVYNGEIYNHNELRAALPPQAWRGHSDTETLLAAIVTWGLEGALRRLVGMFAIALWDRQDRKLFLARDRMGEKPLYYGWQGGVLLFGSELKALRAHPSFAAPVDRAALTLFLRHGYVPTPYSIHQGIRKLPPGTWAEFDASAAPGFEPRIHPYWQVLDVAGMPVRQNLSDELAVSELERLLTQAVRGQMLADVPLGAFLSGGIDSSTVVAVMQKISSRPVKTFSIGFHEDAYNEAQHAKLVARHLGCDHTELYVTPREALDVIPRLPAIYDEPFADASQIPTFLVSQLARQHVTVSLSGDAGDELFAGYDRYFWGVEVWNKVGWCPVAVRQLTSTVLDAIPQVVWDKAFAVLGFALPKRLRFANPGDKMRKLADLLGSRTQGEVYRFLVSQWHRPSDLLAGVEPLTALTDPSRWPKGQGFLDRMMFLDQVSYLPDDILVKVDRAAMANSLETRVPMLDHRLVEFAWGLPAQMKVRNGQGKWLLRQVLHRHVPRELVERPKMGFGVPIGAWLRGPLKDWAAELLAPSRLRQQGFFDAQTVQTRWDEHQSGRREHAYPLWTMLMFQAWLEATDG